MDDGARTVAAAGRPRAARKARTSANSASDITFAIYGGI
jgi:hypothetical protein